VNICKELESELLSYFKKKNIENSVKDDELFEIGKILSDYTKYLKFKSKKQIPFGRYLVFKNTYCNLQIDIFSNNYVGRIHNHKTWGVLCVLAGALKVTDYVMLKKNLIQIRSNFLNIGSFSAFKEDNDWHSTETFDGDQVLSFHLYGNNFDLDNGYYFDKNKGIISYTRGELRSLAVLNPYFDFIT